MRTQALIPMAAAIVSALALGGCCTSKECQLEKVAKDWCLTIRASQVIPVYPLTEDILPGDVFLTSRQIQDEQAEYSKRGFLPLTQHIVRLHPDDIQDFYLSSHGTEGMTNPPYFWRFDGPDLGTNKLRLMPRAAFPSYHFSTRKGAGLNVAIPVQGIPIAMNLVGSSQVDGNVLLKDAYSYGFDQVSLQNQLLEWVNNNSELMKQIAPEDDAGNNYLRMISRVYLVGGVNVSVASASSFAGSLSGGADKPVNLPSLSGTNTVQDYTDSLAALSSSLSTALNAPGGTLKVAAASSRSVSLDETFPRPLVVGYLGFDFQILPGGKLSLPASTLHRLDKKATAGPSGTLVYAADASSTQLRRWLQANQSHAATANEWLSRNYPGTNLANVITAGELREVRHRMVKELIKNNPQ